MILEPISLPLVGVLKEDDRFLPLCRDDKARLLAHLPVGEQTFLTVEDNLYCENILVENQCGEVIIVKRGVDSEIRKFPVGSCASFKLTVPVVKWLICNYDCCTGEAHETIPVALDTGKTFVPSATINAEYIAHIVFTGTEPIKVSVTGHPEWATLDIAGHHVFIYGTPQTVHTHNMVVSAVNGQGQYIATHQFPIVVRQ